MCVPDHDYLNFDPNTCMESILLADDMPTSRESKCEAPQVADSHSEGEEIPNLVKKSAFEEDYVNRMDSFPETSDPGTGNLPRPPIVLPACVSESVEVIDQESTEGAKNGRKGKVDCADGQLDDGEDTTTPETREKIEVATGVRVSQYHTSTRNVVVEKTTTCAPSLIPKVSPKPSAKPKKYVCPPPLSLPSTNTVYDNSPKSKPPTPVRKSSLNGSLTSPSYQSQSLCQLPSKIPPPSPKVSVSRHHSIRDRVESLEKMMNSDSPSSDAVHSETSQQTDAVEDSRDSNDPVPCTIVNGADNVVGVSDHGGSCSPSMRVKKPPLKVGQPKFPLSAVAKNSGAPTSGKTTTLSAKGERSIGRGNAEQQVEDKLQEEKEVGSRTITIAAAPPNNDLQRPRLNKIRNKIAQRKSVGLSDDVRSNTFSPTSQAMKAEGRPNLADIRKKLTEHKPNLKESSGAENNKLPPQHVAVSEPSPQHRKVVENKDKGVRSEVTPVLVVSQPVPPPPSGRLNLPPLPPKHVARTKGTAPAVSEKPQQPANVGGIGAGSLGEEKVAEEKKEDERKAGDSPPPPLPVRTSAMFEVRQPLPGVIRKANSYLNVSLDDASDTSISTTPITTTPSVKSKPTTKKKKTYHFTKLKKDEEVHSGTKKEIVKVGEKKQVSPSTKSSFMGSTVKKTGQATLKHKTEPQTVELRADFVERPLPELPGQYNLNSVPDHTDADYEVFGVENAELDYVNHQNLSKDIMASGKDRLVRSRSQEPVESRSTLSTPTTLLKGHTLGRRECDRRSIPTLQTPTECPDYIDGYVNTDKLPLVSSRPQLALPFDEDRSPALPLRKHSPDNEDNLHYDYPDLHVVGAFARKSVSAKLRKFNVSPSHGQGVGRLDRVSKVDDDIHNDSGSGYVPMGSNSAIIDASYVNSDSIQNVLSDMGLPSRTLHRSTSEHNIVTGEDTSGKEEEDETCNIYMNLPMPERSIQLPRQHSLPASKKHQLKQPGFSKVPSPSVKPKPCKKLPGTVAATSTHQLISKLSQHPQQGWNSTAARHKVGVTGSVVVMQSNQAEEKEGDLPPRNIPRELT